MAEDEQQHKRRLEDEEQQKSEEEKRPWRTHRFEDGGGSRRKEVARTPGMASERVRLQITSVQYIQQEHRYTDMMVCELQSSS